eukprot:165550_1
MEPPPFFSSEDNLDNGYHVQNAASLPAPNQESDEDNEAYEPVSPDETIPQDNMDYFVARMKTDTHEHFAQQLQIAQPPEEQAQQTMPPPFLSNDQSNDNDDNLTPVSTKSRSQQPGAQQLDDSTTQDTPEPYAASSAMSAIPTINRIDQQSQSIPLHPPPPVPAASGTKYNSSDLSSREPPLARNRQHSYNVPPPGVGRVASAGAGVRSRNRKTSPPAPKRLGGKHIPKTKSLNLNEEDGKEFAIDQVSFTAILRQVDVGVEMTDRMKEVVRKFCKHQQMGADKLQEIYHKLPSTYVDSDGMKGFADVCALVHTLILETVSAQKRLADFLFRDVVPKMDGYIKEKQKQIQELKRDNAQAEMKVKNAINAMHKASNTAKNSASKAKQLARESHSKGRKGSYNHDAAKKKKKGKMGGLFNKFGGDNAHHNVPPDEQAYLKAQTNQLNYEASVMAANYEQNTYNEIAARFKRDCKAIEQQRLQYCQDKIQQVVNAHRSYFNNETIMVLQTRILSGLDTLDARREFQDFLHREMSTKSKKPNKSSVRGQEFIATKYDYQNVFHSLKDSMDITHKLAPHAKLPLPLTVCCDKVRELNGFQTEGIFRKSALATEIDRLKEKLSRNKYDIDTKDPHVAACLLKDWLRGLKDSLIPQSHYDMAIQMAKKHEVKQESLEVFLSQLPEVNRETLKYLVRFLKDLMHQDNVPKTRMGLENVAIVFAPTILKCPHTDAKLLLANSRHEKDFTIELLNNLETDH